MVFNISSSIAGNSAAHALSDFSDLILKTDHSHSYIHRLSDACFKLGKKQETYFVETEKEGKHAPTSLLSSEEGLDSLSSAYETRESLSTVQIIDLFQNYVDHAKSIDDEKPIRAFQILRDQLKKEYYSGISGSLAESFYKKFGWFDFNNTPYAIKLTKIFKRLSSLETTPKFVVPQISQKAKESSSIEERIFTDTTADSEAIGAISYGSATVQWMKPGEYLRQVDPYFTRHEDEESMPFLFGTMVDLANGKKSEPKFAPLMMKPSRQQKICEGYSIVEHEGRHRAFAAMRLGIPLVPVAICK